MVDVVERVRFVSRHGPNVLALVEVVATRRVKLPDPVIVC